MPRLYLPSTTTPLVTPLPDPEWDLLGAGSSANQQIGWPHAAGDVVVWMGATDGVSDPDGPDLDGSWERIVRVDSPSGLATFAAWTRIVPSSSFTFTNPHTSGFSRTSLATWRPTAPGSTLAVAAADTNLSSNDTPPIAREAGSLHLALYHGTRAHTGTLTWRSLPPQLVTAGKTGSGTMLITMMGWTEAPPATLASYASDTETDTAGNQAATSAVVGYSA